MIARFATYGPRLLSRVLPEAEWRGDPFRRSIYLTFDDGPNPGVTEPILRSLEENDAHATFFLLGENAVRYPDLVRDIHRAGHSIGAHGYAHSDPWRQKVQDLLMNFEQGCSVVERIINRDIRMIRPPYGHHRRSLAHWAKDTGRRVIMWDVMPADFVRGAIASKVEQFVRSTVRPGSIIVLHDNPNCASVTLPVLDSLLPALREDGWRLRALL